MLAFTWHFYLAFCSAEFCQPLFFSVRYFNILRWKSTENQLKNKEKPRNHWDYGDSYYGAGGGNRTHNLLITSELLCHWATPAATHGILAYAHNKVNWKKNYNLYIQPYLYSQKTKYRILKNLSYSSILSRSKPCKLSLHNYY